MPPKQSGSLLELCCSHWAQQESGKCIASSLSAKLNCTGPADAQARLDCIYSVWFNFLGRDFFNALSEKDTERFTQMLIKWLCSLFVGIPVSHSTYVL